MLKWNKFIILIVFSLLISCSIEEVETDSLVQRQGLYYKVNSEKAFSGNAVMLYRNGQKMMQSTIKNGVVDGTVITWYENGQKSSSGEMYRMNRLGQYSSWFENGNQKISTNYSNSKKNGHFTEWYESGTKKIQSLYISDTLDNAYFEWYMNGMLKTEANYLRGKLNGKYSSWAVDGSIEEEGLYKNNMKVGIWAEQNGYVQGQYSYGTRVGNWKYTGPSVVLHDPLYIQDKLESKQYSEMEIFNLVKVKYPQYTNTADELLSKVFFEKYPDYKLWLQPVEQRFREVEY